MSDVRAGLGAAPWGGNRAIPAHDFMQQQAIRSERTIGGLPFGRALPGVSAAATIIDPNGSQVSSMC